MTLKDLIKKAKPEDYDKVIIFSDGIGWTNINVKFNECDITITGDRNEICQTLMILDVVIVNVKSDLGVINM